MCHLIKLAEHIFLNLQFIFLAIHLAGFSVSTRILYVKGASSLDKGIEREKKYRTSYSLTVSRKWLFTTDEVISAT